MSASKAPPPLETTHIIGGNVKQAKFDRQLRLWGADGQVALETAHVVALGVTLAIAEALKSLVLTGVRTVTLVDERVVSGEDVGTNYFVTPTAVGSPLAATVLRHICVLGEQCSAVPVQESPREWAAKYTAAVDEDWAAGCVGIGRGWSFTAARETQTEPGLPTSAVLRLLAGYAPLEIVDSSASFTNSSRDDSTHQPSLPSLILVSERYGDLSPMSPLLQSCTTRVHPDVPVLLVRSSGLLGMLQTYCCDRVITRPQNPTQVQMEDLRIFEPFPALQAWFDAHDPDDAAQFPVDSADAMTLHSYLPYPCIVHHAFRRWWAALPEEEKQSRQQSKSSSTFPLTTNDYRAISSFVGGMIRRQNPPEEAFVEAMEKCTAKLNRPVVQQLPEALAELLRDARCADPMRAMKAAQSRVSPAALMSPFPATCQMAALLVWGCPEVLVWFILQAVKLFVTGKVGGEREADNVASDKSPTVRQSRASAGEGEDGCVTAYTEALPFRPIYAAYHMPYSGYLPDFTTTTIWYRELQDLYQAKHAADVACIAATALELVEAALLQEEEQARAREDAEEQQQFHGPLMMSPLATRLKPLLLKHTETVVENIWDIRGVRFSAAYRSTTEAEWRQRLGRRLVWLTRYISFDVEWSADARRAACFAVAFLSKEELQRRCVRVAESGLSGSSIAQEAAVLMSQASQVKTALSDEDDKGLTRQPFDESVASWWDEEGSQRVFTQTCEEVARWSSDKDGNRACMQLPSVAASTGALAAQEAVKLLMRIRVPCAQPMLYDGYTNKVFLL
ncbi:ThiF family [Leishmania braziliensis]|nr:ThiF family [Leishmania braziliensis]